MTEAEYARVAILGSCVSRDMVRISMTEEVKYPLYIARQSILSYGRPAKENKPVEPDLTSNFQLEAYRSDVSAACLKRVLRQAAETDLVLMDIVDERHGIYRSTEGEVITRSIDGISKGVYDQLADWQYIEFGSTEHLEDYTSQAAMVRDELTKAGLIDKTFIIMAPWATHLLNGEKSPLSMGKTAAWANDIIPVYGKVLIDLGFNAVRPVPETVIADPDHKWGPAPFHYIPAFYDSIATQIHPHVQKALADR